MENRNPYREDFPLLANNPVIYLDSAATAQKPGCVLRAERDFYEQCYANPMRGFYELSMEATKRLEEAREEVRRFINAPSADEIIFTRNTTESLNLIAYSYGLSKLKAGDEILVSIMEHHSNLLPWQMAAGKTGAVLRFLECEPDGRHLLTGPDWRLSPTSPMCWDVKIRYAGLRPWPENEGLWWWWMQHRALLISQLMYRSLVWIFWPFPVIS